MKYVFIAILLLLILIVAYWGCQKADEGWDAAGDPDIQVLIVYNEDHLESEENSNIMDAYESVLDEEGIPNKRFEVRGLFDADPEQLAATKPVLIFPDGAAQFIPRDIRDWLVKYMHHGGSIALIYDPGTRDRKGHFLKETVFAGVTGINFITYSEIGEYAYGQGKIRITQESLKDYLEIPPGKVDEDGYLTGYMYGPLKYPVARAKKIEPLGDCEFYSEVETEDVTDDDKSKGPKDKKDAQYRARLAEYSNIPAIVVRKFEKGKVLYVNMPLGHLKAYSDDLPLRSIMRSFILKDVGFPHVMNVPYGKGGLVWNWHVDDNSDWESIPYLVDNGYIKDILEYSFHITAGDFVQEEGDGFGFDACDSDDKNVGMGPATIKTILEYGEIGSHGGWAHNWFADRMVANMFTMGEVEEVILKNNKCLNDVVFDITQDGNRKVREYSAPDGVFKQPQTNKILEDLGFIAYYNTADTGSGPNRTFVNGKSATDKVISFPVMPNGKTASISEMVRLEELTPAQIAQWMNSTAEFIRDKKVVRLMYSHPYDFTTYIDPAEAGPLKEFFDNIEQMQKMGELQVRSMTYFAEFLLRMISAKTSFIRTDKGMKVHIKTEDAERGLSGFTIAIPKSKYSVQEQDGLEILDDDRYHLLVVGTNDNEISFDVLFN